MPGGHKPGYSTIVSGLIVTGAGTAEFFADHDLSTAGVVRTEETGNPAAFKNTMVTQTAIQTYIHRMKPLTTTKSEKIRITSFRIGITIIQFNTLLHLLPSGTRKRLLVLKEFNPMHSGICSTTQILNNIFPTITSIRY